MAYRKRGRRWASSRRRSSRLVWFETSISNTNGPINGVVDSEPLLAPGDYQINADARKERIRVHRVIIAMGLYSTTPSQASFDASIFDCWLSAESSDVHAANVTAGLGYTAALLTDSRIVRAATKQLLTTQQVTAVGFPPPVARFSLSWNVKTKLVLTSPDTLYFNLKNSQLEGSTDVTEWWLRSRVLYESLM